MEGGGKRFLPVRVWGGTFMQGALQGLTEVAFKQRTKEGREETVRSPGEDISRQRQQQVQRP